MVLPMPEPSMVPVNPKPALQPFRKWFAIAVGFMALALPFEGYIRIYLAGVEAVLPVTIQAIILIYYVYAVFKFKLHHVMLLGLFSLISVIWCLVTGILSAVDARLPGNGYIGKYEVFDSNQANAIMWNICGSMIWVWWTASLAISILAPFAWRAGRKFQTQAYHNPNNHMAVPNYGTGQPSNSVPVSSSNGNNVHVMRNNDAANQAGRAGNRNQNFRAFEGEGFKLGGS